MVVMIIVAVITTVIIIVTAIIDIINIVIIDFIIIIIIIIIIVTIILITIITIVVISIVVIIIIIIIIIANTSTYSCYCLCRQSWRTEIKRLQHCCESNRAEERELIAEKENILLGQEKSTQILKKQIRSELFHFVDSSLLIYYFCPFIHESLQ